MRLALFSAVFVGCASETENVVDPVSPACLECLTDRNSRTCGAIYDACETFSSCDDFVMCQLMGRCFERPSGSGCERELGCRQPPGLGEEDAGDAGASASPKAVAEEFEQCARTRCAETCGFVE